MLVGRYAAALNAGEFVLAGDTCLLVRAGWCWLLVGRYAATLNAGEFVLVGDTCLLVRAGWCWLLVRAGCGFLVFGYQKLL